MQKKEKNATVIERKSKLNGYGNAFRAAFPLTIPVLTGYLFIGMAFGVMIQEKGYNFLWAMLMSVVIYAGSGQYLAVQFFTPGVSLLQIIFMEFMLNIRHIFYGLSLLERFSEMGRKRLYMIFSLTDETYSLFFITKTPEGVDEDKFLFAIALLDHSYWIIGSGIGALLGSAIPFNTNGIDFAMTALFTVIMVEQWMEKKNRPNVIIGLACGLICLLIFGPEDFILPTMLLILAGLIPGYRRFRQEMEPSETEATKKPEVTEVATSIGGAAKEKTVPETIAAGTADFETGKMQNMTNDAAQGEIAINEMAVEGGDQ